MFCEKCGMPIEDGHRLCAACSAEESYVPDHQPECITLNYDGHETPKKSGNGKKIAWIAGAAVLVILLVVALWKPIAGLFAKDKKYASPQEQFAYVEGQNASSLAGSFSSTYGNYLALFDSQSVGKEAELRLSFNQEIMALLSQVVEMDMQWLNDLTIRLKGSSDSSAMQILASLNLGQTEILNADIGMNFSDKVMWMGIPTLSDDYLGQEMEIELDPEFADFYDVVSTILEALPDEQVLYSILNRYLDIAVSNITNVESSTVTLRAGDISQKCTALKATLDQKTLRNVLTAILENAKDDQELRAVAEQIAEAYSPGSGKMISGGWGLMLQGLIDELSAEEPLEMDESLIWIDYVNADDQIIGREFKLGESGQSVHYWTVSQDDAFAFEASFGQVLITGNGTDSKGKINAKYLVSDEQQDVFNIEIMDFDSILWDRGELCGTVRIRLAQELMSEMMGPALLMDMAFDLRLDTTAADCQIGVDLVVTGEVLASLEFRMKDIAPFEIQIPRNLLPADYENIAAWESGLDMEKLLDNLLKAGFPEELFTESELLPQEAA